MAISFIRVDDRIIHGQIVTRWLSELPADGVVAVDDAAASNPVISRVLKGAVPGGLRAFVMTVDHTAERWEDIVGSSRNYFLLAKSPITLARLYRAGADFISVQPNLNVGPMSEREGAIRVGPNANVLPEEMKAFQFLADKGMNINFQLVPDSKKTTFTEAVHQYKG